MRRAALALVMVATIGTTQGADVLPVVNVGSKHLDTEEQFNERNLGLGLHLYNSEHDAYTTLGAYNNSIRRNSYYLGVGYKLGSTLAVGVEVGMVSGYAKGLAPFVVPTVWIGPAKLLYIPKIEGANKVHTLGLQVELPLQLDRMWL